METYVEMTPQQLANLLRDERESVRRSVESRVALRILAGPVDATYTPTEVATIVASAFAEDDAARPNVRVSM